MKNFEYFAPKTIKEILELLNLYQNQSMIIAGGTDLLVNIKKGKIKPTTLISLKNVTDLAYIKEIDNEVKIGSTTTIADIEFSKILRERYPVLTKAASAIGSTQIRNRGTLGGNICLSTRCMFADEMEDCRKWGGKKCYIAPKGDKCHALLAGDLIPALVALDAEVIVNGENEKHSFPVESLYSGDGCKPINIKNNMLVLGVKIPKNLKENMYSSFVKFTLKKLVDFSLLSVAITIILDNRTQNVKACRIVLGSVSSLPLRAKEAEKIVQSNDIMNVDPLTIGEITANNLKLTSYSYAPIWYKRQVVKAIVEEEFHNIQKNIQEKFS